VEGIDRRGGLVLLRDGTDVCCSVACWKKADLPWWECLPPDRADRGMYCPVTRHSAARSTLYPHVLRQSTRASSLHDGSPPSRGLTNSRNKASCVTGFCFPRTVRPWEP
jgi:hypothetical protein